FVGLANYERVLNNKMFQLGLRNTWELSLMCAPVIWLLAFLLSAMLKSVKDHSLMFRNELLQPYLMPSSAMLLIWLLMFDYGGVINRLVVQLGFERQLWLEGDALRFPIVMLYIWKNLGFSVVLFSSALAAVHPSLYEYASLEGAGWWTQAFRITLPQILPTAFLVFVLAWVNAFKIFKEVYFIGGAYPTEAVYTLQHYMNNKFAKLEYQDVTTAAYLFAVGVMVLFALMYASKAVRSPDER
ncbi:MAG: sugar ABC transporter permease, partial [Clostridia bacterium]|nr:sugar ABC transporter permease [Clostridia bacterium]